MPCPKSCCKFYRPEAADPASGHQEGLRARPGPGPDKEKQNKTLIREMKKYLILSAAALLTLAACTKQVTAPEEQREISFQVANVLQTKADDGTAGQDDQTAKPGEFTNADFGAYCWRTPEAGAREVVEYFSNERVAKVGGAWRTTKNTFYWPKSDALDFICYSPYNEGTPSVTDRTIEWTQYSVKKENQKDLMYADKAVAQTGNTNTYFYNGVPTLFRHALAKVSFQVKANFLTYTRQEEKDEQGKVIVGAGTTTWEVTLKSAKISGIKTTGNLALIADADGKWPLPEMGDGKYHVWDKPSGALDIDLLPVEETPVTTNTGAAQTGMALTEKPQALLDGQSFFVLPQILEASADNAPAQTLTISLEIKTFLSNGDKEPMVEKYEKTLDLKNISSLKAWQMNQNIIYTICIKPTAIEDPNNPDDPTDVEITFDPAVVGWEEITTDANILI